MKILSIKFPIILLSFVAVFLTATLTSCFTGIESTPKITSNDVKRQHIPVRSEDSYLADIVPAPFSEWKPGKEFYVSDKKFALLLPPSDGVEEISDSTVIRYMSHKELTDISGSKAIDIYFLTPRNNTVTYRLPRSIASIKDTEVLSIPFLVDMDVVEKVRNKLRNQTYYVMTSSWYDTRLQSFTGRKFVPVTIKEVLPGNAYYSAVLVLTDDKGLPFRLMLSVGNDLKSLRHFSSLFSLTNPRNNYPQITDEHWDNIIHGKVSTDMTREECRLALGSPASVDRGVGYSSVREIWSYENGIYLIFEDNLLRSFRQ